MAQIVDLEKKIFKHFLYIFLCLQFESLFGLKQGSGVMILTISLYMHMYVRSLIGIDISISSAVFLLFCKKYEKFTYSD